MYRTTTSGKRRQRLDAAIFNCRPEFRGNSPSCWLQCRECVFDGPYVKLGDACSWKARLNGQEMWECCGLDRGSNVVERTNGGLPNVIVRAIDALRL